MGVPTEGQGEDEERKVDCVAAAVNFYLEQERRWLRRGCENSWKGGVCARSVTLTGSVVGCGGQGQTVGRQSTRYNTAVQYHTMRLCRARARARRSDAS